MKFYQVTRSSWRNGCQCSTEVDGTFADLESAKACFYDTAQFLKENAVLELRNKGARLRLKNEKWGVELCEIFAENAECADIEDYGEIIGFYDFCPVDLPKQREYEAEVYEDNVGQAYLIIYDNNGNIAWCAGYLEAWTDAASDFIAIINGADPIAECWERGTLEDLYSEDTERTNRWICEATCNKLAFTLIASTYGYENTFKSLLEFDSQGSPMSGRFAIALGDYYA